MTVLGASLALTGCAGVTFGSAVPNPAASSPAPVSAPAAVAVYATGAGDVPLADVVVTLRPADAPPGPARPAPATLDLMHRHFEPQVLTVPVGAEVAIHNLDDVNHDLYSFSPALPFSLHLTAKGGRGAVTAAHAGVVVLGCKVHDEMVGYLYVTDAPFFGKTDANGYLRLAELKPGRYTLGMWRARGADEAHPLTLTLTAGTEEAVRLRL